jgi:hypothetical protein
MTHGTNGEKIFMRWAAGILVAALGMSFGHITTREAMSTETTRQISEMKENYVPRHELDARLTDMKSQLNRIEANQRGK